MRKIIARRTEGDPYGYTIEVYDGGFRTPMYMYSSMYKPVLSNGSLIFETPDSFMSLSADIIQIMKED